MISHLDNLLRQLFLDQISDLTNELQVGFQPPDEQWRNNVTNLPPGLALALNVYLIDLRENRKLRSNERVSSIDINNGVVHEEPAPARLDCHYLVTAWSRVQPSPPTVEPSLDEHALLYQVTEALMRSDPLNPSQIYPPGSAALIAWPERFRDVNLPLMALPVEGFGKLSEFWQSMGQGARWKPAVYLIVTLPVTLLQIEAGLMVTTRITEYRQTGQPGSAEVWIQQIGGYVLDTLNPLPDGTPAPVAEAWVQLESLGGEPLQTVTTDILGRFIFENLQPGDYQLRWRAGLRPEPAPRAIAIPSPTGEYDLRF